MDSDYVAAQRLYVRRGYAPDGRGLVWHNQFLRHGEQVTVDDNLILHFVKTLPEIWPVETCAATGSTANHDNRRIERKVVNFFMGGSSCSGF
jgi:hypothetical protein